MEKREIPIEATEIQPGLWAHRVRGVGVEFFKLYSAQGYCFYDREEEGSDGALDKTMQGQEQAENRKYATYAVLAVSYDRVEKINECFVSVPIQEGMEIV